MGRGLRSHVHHVSIIISVECFNLQISSQSKWLAKVKQVKSRLWVNTFQMIKSFSVATYAVLAWSVFPLFTPVMDEKPDDTFHEYAFHYNTEDDFSSSSVSSRAWLFHGKRCHHKDDAYYKEIISPLSLQNTHFSPHVGVRSNMPLSSSASRASSSSLFYRRDVKSPVEGRRKTGCRRGQHGRLPPSRRTDLQRSTFGRGEPRSRRFRGKG